MKSMFLVFSLFLASCLAITEPTYEELAFKANFEEAMARAGITPRMLESNIIAIIDKTLNDLPEYIDNYTINITNPNQTIVANGYIQNATIAGMKNHTIDGVKFSVLPLGFNMHLNLADVLVNGQYDIDALLLKLIPVYGGGAFSAGAHAVDVVVDVDMTSTGGFLSVTSLSFQFTVSAVTFRFDNLLGGDLGVVISEMIQDNFPTYVERIMYYYGDNIEGEITSVVNTFLSNKTVNDLIDWIKQTTTEAPTTVPTVKLY